MRSRSSFPTPLRLALLSAVCLGAAPGLGAFDLFERLSVRVSPGARFSLGGSYNDSSKFRDVVGLGGGLNLGLRYEAGKNAFFDLAYGYEIMPIKSGVRPFAFRHTDSYFDMSSITLNAQLYLKSGYAMEPYLAVGGGLYPWSFRSGMFGGAVWPAPARPQTELRDTSPGLNLGIGVEANLFVKLTALFEIRYTYLFTRNPGRFGTDDLSQVDFLGLTIGVIYYFKRK